MKNITYLLGAGASYNALPIQQELGEKMIELADIMKSLNLKDNSINTIIKNLKEFGKKALEFGTIDTYARKLSFHKEDVLQLEKLKKTVSLFFTIWQFVDDDTTDLKIFKNKEEDNSIIRKAKTIDSRYISLMATILEKVKENIKIKDNINFVTWNYDLQLELAAKQFCNGNDGKGKIKWKDFEKVIRFNSAIEDGSNLKICHLNGFCGYYDIAFMNEKKENLNVLDTIKSKDIQGILNDIFNDNTGLNYKSDFNKYINYAWEEENNLTKKAIKQAEQIFEKTDILVVIGYSFPTFNKDIDKLLFDKLKSNVEIYYQDLNSIERISHLVKNKNIEVQAKKDLLQFFLPYDF